MKSPVIVVAIALTAAILVAASLLIHAGTRKTPTSTLNNPVPAASIRMIVWGAQGWRDR